MYSQTHVLTKQSSHIYIKKPQPKVMDPLSIFCIQETNIQQPILGHKNLGSDMDRLVRFGHKYSLLPFYPKSCYLLFPQLKCHF